MAKRNIKGAGHGSKEEEAIWHEFESDWDSLAFESERLRLGKAEVESVRVDEEFPEGITRDALVKLRVNQGFFRSAVLSAYGAACCITGINVPALLCASHIVPWSRDVKNRANPSNGLCLNALHDRAFDRGLLTITPDYRVMISPKITSLKRQEGLATMLLSHEGKVIAVPKHFLPGKDFLRHHNENIFQS